MTVQRESTPAGAARCGGRTVGRVILMAGCFAALLGCAAPRIDSSRFAAPRSVVLADFPDPVSVASIEFVIPQGIGYYFSSRFDGFFTIDDKASPLPGIADNAIAVDVVVAQQIYSAPRPLSVGNAAAAGAVGGVVGGLIQASGMQTQAKAADFPDLLRKAAPDIDLHRDLIAALQDALRSKQIEVRLDPVTRNQLPRLRWPAKNDKGDMLPTGPLVDSAPVDADLLVQIVPVAVYAAPGPLNPYRRRVGIGVALFDGRTRQFIGWQAVAFNGDFRFVYATYDGLVDDIDQAGHALRSALLSLVPQVAEIIGGAKRASR